MNASDATIRLKQIVIEAYKRRSRQLPANIPEIVDTLKADVLKYMPSVSIETIDEAITFETLHDDKTQLSPAFLFAAIRKHWQEPYKPRHWDVNEDKRPDFEADTVKLLDICAEWVKKSDDQQRAFTVQTKDGIVVELPAFNARREFAYLVMRRQLTEESLTHFFDAAITDINTERMASRHHRLTREEAKNDPDVVARQKRLAVIDWLRSCNTSNATPSEILTPLANDKEYQMLRREI